MILRREGINPTWDQFNAMRPVAPCGVMILDLIICPHRKAQAGWLFQCRYRFSIVAICCIKS